MNCIQFTIQANQYQQEELIALLSDYNPIGFEERATELVAYFEEDHFNETDIKKIINAYAFQQTTVEEQNWNAVWESNFQPVVVEDFVAVRAHFHGPINNVEHEILITPKMSFGTGHHATTHMMMKLMREIDFKGKTVFDFGTGTGILAILAEKLGASNIMAIDVDDWSIENTRENIERNHCSKIDVSLSSNIPDQQFDILLANINRNVLLQYATLLKKALDSDGLLLLSGLLTTDQDEIVSTFQQQGLHFIRRAEKDNWIALLFSTKSKG